MVSLGRTAANSRIIVLWLELSQKLLSRTRSYLAQSLLCLLMFTGRYLPLAHFSKSNTPVIKMASVYIRVDPAVGRA